MFLVCALSLPPGPPNLAWALLFLNGGPSAAVPRRTHCGKQARLEAGRDRNSGRDRSRLQTLIHSSDLEFGEMVGGLAEIDRGQVLAVGRAGGGGGDHRQAEGAGASRPSELALLGRMFDLRVEAQSEKRDEMLASPDCCKL